MNTRAPVPRRIRILQYSLIAIVGLASFGILISPTGLSPTLQAVSEGDVAQSTIKSPRDIEYVSEIRTEEARTAAESAVQPVYSLPDPAIAREQIERLRTSLQNITSIRDNADLTTDETRESLLALSDLRLKAETVDYLLGISDVRWDAVQAEAVRVLEQVMRRAIYDDKVEVTQAGISALVSLTFNEPQTELVTELVSPFVVSNSFFSQELTDAAKLAAREAIQPIVQTYKAGETIVPAGEIITPADVEAFQQLGMIRPGQRWEDIAAAAAMVLLCAAFVPAYFYRKPRTVFLNDPKNLLIISLIFIFFLAGARLFAERTLAPYGYPIQAAALLFTGLFSLEVGLVFAIPLAILAAFGLPNSYDLIPYYMFSSLMGLLALGPARRFWGFVRAGIAISFSGAAALLAFRIPLITLDWLGILQYVGVIAFAGFSSASIALLLQYIFAQILGLTTALQLLDISRPDFPLLQFFLRNAPGTYQHSLQVANLAEQAAEKIGADPLLTRVGALFHDIGKALNPNFFIENQAQGNLNAHNNANPEEVSATIVRHVTDGVQLAKKHRLPRRLQDFILEHHGTLITHYQYNQAMEAAGGDVTKVDIEKFRYPGPRPASRETALLMLADASEARARAERPGSDDEIRALVTSVIQTVQKYNQLDDTLLTLRDLKLITESFVTTLRGTYHPRIQYPKAAVPDQDTTLLVSRKEK
ncbi:MAG: HDIG domain-containing protein [Anaerolineales bacterium]|uniref:HD family phosphohydrolase n=1 Tax=Candidatus Villigracilis vicinus TaxID=3140679 RepID=UPI0031376AD8|nr:HDIG domain-containing protein [Anaerolineales bacterium]MBK9780359.1 HDIG domain-containing protein [Anaerolineales bacterium]